MIMPNHRFLSASVFSMIFVLSHSYSFCRLGRCNAGGNWFRTASAPSSSRLFGGGKRRDGLGKPKGYADLKSRYVLDRHTLSGLPDSSKPFLVLGIESSCDDTGAAIVRSDGTILSNVVYSQYEIHERFGGVVPGLAMEAHKTNIDKAVAGAIEKAGLKSLDEVDAICVTKGPGLEICLRVGLRKAQALAKEFNKPFVTIHHLEAHCMMARLAGNEIVDESTSTSTSTTPISTSSPSPTDPLITYTANDDTDSSSNDKLAAARDFKPKVQYPFLALLASGGHTSILLCKQLGDYEVLGGTLDDALGEAFDKAARLLGLRTGGSGGAAVELAALQGQKNSYTMSVPMRDKPNCDFSYAGLKNAFRVAVQTAREQEGLDVNSTNAPASQMEAAPDTPVTLSERATADLCATFQDVAFSHVEDRIKRALDYIDNNNVPVTSLVVVGGVAANRELRRRLLSLLDARAVAERDERERRKMYDPTLDLDCVTALEPIQRMKLVFPPPSLCTDNGVMAAWAGIEKLSLGISDEIEGQEAVARWPLGSPIDDGKAVFKKRDLKAKVAAQLSEISSSGISAGNKSSTAVVVNSSDSTATARESSV